MSCTLKQRQVSILSGFSAFVALGLLLGCQETADRVEVRGNGQGGVEITHAPREPAPARTEAVTSSVSSATPETPRVTSGPAPSSDAAILRRLEQLEAENRELKAENQRLRTQSPPPATRPG